jgi:two-component system sensor kinase FixL
VFAEDLHHKIAAFQQQVETLRATAVSPEQAQKVLLEVFEALHVSLEALHVAEEELLQQHDDLAVARQAAEVAHQQYQDLFDFAPDGYLVTDHLGIIQQANRAAATLLAMPQHRLVGKRMLTFVPPAERQAFRAQLRVLATGQRRQDWEVRLQPQGGQPFEAALTVAAVQRVQGQGVGLHWLIRDITTRKQGERVLRDSKTRQHAILQTAVDGIIIIDEGGIVESFNPAAERLFGYTANEVIGQNVSMLMPSPYRDEHDGYIARYLQTSEPHIIGIGREVRAQRRDGTTFPTALAVSAMHLDGRRMFTGVVHDLTARVQAEEALRRARDELELRVQERTAELAAANEEVRRFAYIVSHDLRAPLVNLKGFASELRAASVVLQEALPKSLPHLEAPQRVGVSRALDQDNPEALAFIDTAVTRMDHLIRAILHLSRLGRRELHLEPLDMLALVQGTVQTLAHQITQRQVQVTVEPLPTVMADRTAMEQIMGNLLANAVAYLASGRPGEILVTAACCPESTVFHVRDNGRGIAAEDISKVFEPFRRVGTQDVPGEGMGLAYVHMLVRRHGGDLQCHSRLGVGTTFTFTIAHQLPEGETYAG